MKIVNISHGTIFSHVADIIYDMALIDNEPNHSWLFLIEDLKTPEAFVRAVTTDGKAFTYLCTIDFDALEAHYETTGEDMIIVVNRYNHRDERASKPWATVLFSQLEW